MVSLIISAERISGFKVLSARAMWGGGENIAREIGFFEVRGGGGADDRRVFLKRF